LRFAIRNTQRIPLQQGTLIDVYAHGMSKVHLSGQLVCRDQAQAAVVAEHLSDHVARTRAERGCLSFSVTSTDDPMVWQVEECFQNSSALKSHQDRVAGSSWGRATVGIERHYLIDGH
jgi:quinol monooxygenase YgiN